MHTPAPSSFSCLCLPPHLRLLGLQTRATSPGSQRGLRWARAVAPRMRLLFVVCFFIYDFNLLSYLTLLSDKLGTMNTVRVASPEDHTVDAMPAILLLCFSQFPTGEERLTLNHSLKSTRLTRRNTPPWMGDRPLLRLSQASASLGFLLLLTCSPVGIWLPVAVFLLYPQCLGPLIWGLREVGPLLSWISTSFSLRYCS